MDISGNYCYNGWPCTGCFGNYLLQSIICDIDETLILGITLELIVSKDVKKFRNDPRGHKMYIAHC